MIIEIKQFLNGENDDIPNKIQEISQTEEGFKFWKNVIFKFRKLNTSQIEKIYHLFETSYIKNIPEISSQEKLTEYLQLCRLCSNFTEGKYIKFEEIYKKLLQQQQDFIYEKLLVLGEYELIHQGLTIEQISQVKPLYLKKFLKYILLNKLDEYIKYLSLIKQNPQLLLKLALNAKVKQNTEQILYNISKETTIHKDLFDSLILNWSNKNFIKHASFKTQLYCSHLIVLFINDGFNNDLIHDGIQKRLNSQANIPRKCGILVWKAFVKSLNIQVEDGFDELNDDEVDEVWNEKKKEEIIQKENETQIIQPAQDFHDFEIENEENEQPLLVKNLYDCILALRSEDQSRIEQALKHLPYLIRNSLDLHIHGQTLCDILILNRDWKNSQEEMRIKALVALSIMQPLITDHLIEVYFSEEISIMQRIYILKIIRESAIELSSNPKKYQLENYNNFEKSQNDSFYFKQISTTYKTEEQAAIKIRPAPQSRRWGHTKRAYEGLQIVSPYINRFHQLTEHFYFPLLIYSQSKHKLLLAREPLLMLNFLEVLLRMLDCGQNALHISKMVFEAFDFLLNFDKNKNIEIILMKLRIILKITILLKGQFDDRLEKILSSLKYDDPQAKQLYDLILQNLGF
ncbi:unnamed protein product (macronuclear) [Paramecium tetraurelia]|uniref:Telomere length regulation protein conserved domain-containing protein n=1 Tax=Paramecium tetraurelia TaxID=5888 RepID=A0DX68_PARTE|nr:uncharacterized protein GSPATT00021267001 [Paramecium tetraurelia]CAK87635.1 unnamed protein product [Paramecium tetraurelia]|eukprot:XP_001455032.1 hypothetical protein (macronuclear) [Paramecium tetraurelia strain d4-2]